MTKLRGQSIDVISIHALRKESDVLQITFTQVHPISIHALRKESDCGVVPGG